jgi:S-DNA-T family DNA segregation ATPase FtsK/SpoIIIE
MKCDLRPITSRISYKAAKPQDSVTILGEGGADKLLGRGEMYFKSQQHSGLMYLKGARITEDEVEAVCNHIRAKYEDTQWDDTYKFTIDMNATVVNMEDSPFAGSIATTQEIEDALFARIIIWSLDRETVSADALKFAFTTDKVGERQAKRFVERLYSFGIVGEAIEKLPRKVLITCVEDLPDEVIGFLNSHGYKSEGVELDAPE